jgi:putative ABC transport system permease protein
MKPGLWLRWSIRDLRARWVQVAVIAMIIAVGTGVFAGLGSTARWRRLTNDESYRAVRMHDLRVELAEGSLVPEGMLIDAVGSLPGVALAQERLTVPVQVDASAGDETILVPGRLISFDPSRRTRIDEPFVMRGSGIDSFDQEALLEANFADHYALPDSGTVRLGSGMRLGYSGVALAPEYFMVMTEEGGMMAEANFAALFAPLEVVQSAGGVDGMINDLVMRVSPGVDIADLRDAIEQRLTTALPGTAATVHLAHDDLVHRVLYEDIENDQKFWTVFALLIFAGAVFAAFNLTSRMVESQRRQIGIGMAIGVPRWKLALRPLLVAFEIAILGVVFGVAIGIGVGAGLRTLFVSMIPMPIWRTPFQTDMFARAAALGLVLPFVAAAWPVWRAVRVAPVDAIRTAHLAAKSGLAPLVKRLPLPKRTTVRMPLSNVARAPRRTVLTALGIAASIAALVATLGMLDSFIRTIETGETEQLQAVPDRMTAELSGFVPLSSKTLAAIREAPAVERAEPAIRVAGRVVGEEDIDLRIQLLDLEGGMWTPSITRGSSESGDGIVLSEEAAEDLNLDVGDEILLEHPFRVDKFSLTRKKTRIEVVGLHPNPMRAEAFMDDSNARLMGLEGFANSVQVDPLAGQADVRRELFDVPSVVSVQSVAAIADLYRELVSQFVDILRFLQLFVLALAVLIAFNATSINLDERARENATMFAFGMRVRTVLRMTTVEGLVVGILGTAIGVIGGLAIVSWMVSVLIEDTMPELGMSVTLTGSTVTTALVLGVIAVAIAPLFAVRKLRRMDIPSTLRVVE